MSSSRFANKRFLLMLVLACKASLSCSGPGAHSSVSQDRGDVQPSAESPKSRTQTPATTPWTATPLTSLMALGLGTNLVGVATGASRASEMAATAEKLGALLSVRIPATPDMSRELQDAVENRPGARRAVAMNDLLTRTGPALTEELRRAHGRSHAGLFQLGIRMAFVATMYLPEEGEALAEAVAQDARQAGLPKEMWGSAVAKIRSGASRDDVRESIGMLYKNISSFFDSQRTRKATTDSPVETPQEAFEDCMDFYNTPADQVIKFGMSYGSARSNLPILKAGSKSRSYCAVWAQPSVAAAFSGPSGQLRHLPESRARGPTRSDGERRARSGLAPRMRPPTRQPSTPPFRRGAPIPHRPVDDPATKELRMSDVVLRRRTTRGRELHRRHAPPRRLACL